MKKEIKQEVFTNVHIEITHKTLHFTQKSAYPNSVVIEKSKAREVALSICPELGEPTIKTDNTKVILHLESELKEAVELIENARFLIYTATFDDPNICELMKKDIESFSNKSEAFITKHKSKE